MDYYLYQSKGGGNWTLVSGPFTKNQAKKEFDIAEKASIADYEKGKRTGKIKYGYGVSVFGIPKGTPPPPKIFKQTYLSPIA